MTDDHSIPGGRRRRPPPPVIDLTATDVSPDGRAGAGAPGDASAASDDAAREESTPDARPFWRDWFARLRLEPAWLPSRSWLLAIGAGVGAVVVLVIVAWLGAWLAFPGRDDSDLAARIARLEAQRNAGGNAPSGAALNELNQRLARLEAARAAPSAGAPDPALANRLSTLEGETKVLADAVANLNRRVDESAATAREARTRADAAAKSLADLAGQLAQFNAERARTPPAAERRDVEDVSRRIAALEANIKSLGEQLGRSADAAGERALRSAVLALALNRAVERGAPYARELAALDPQAAGAARAALAPFADSGIPSAQTLSRELLALIPAARDAAHVEAPTGGFLDRLSANAERLVRVRPIGQPQGDEPAAVLARLESAAARNDVAAALAEAAKLPPAARAPLEPWIKRAQAREAALAAAAKLADVSDLARPGAQGAPAR